MMSLWYDRSCLVILFDISLLADYPVTIDLIGFVKKFCITTVTSEGVVRGFDSLQATPSLLVVGNQGAWCTTAVF